MSKRDYIAIAAMIQATRNAPSADDACEYIARELAAYAAKQNPIFDRDKFMEATR